jgi:GNAT superfamily N-acetyltransferase
MNLGLKAALGAAQQFIRARAGHSNEDLLRPGQAIDVPWMTALAVEAGLQGHLHGDYRLSSARVNIETFLRAAVQGRTITLGPDRTDLMARIWVRSRGNQRFGYVLVIEHQAGSWSSMVEINLMVVDHAYRHQGLGKEMLGLLVQALDPAVIYARCLVPSMHMVKLLEDHGFVLTHQSDQSKRLQLTRGR